MTYPIILEDRRPENPGAQIVDLAGWCRSRYTALLAEAQEFMIQGRDEDALDRCRQAFRYSTDPSEAVGVAATVATLVDQPEAGLAFAREAIRMAPDEADGYYELAATLIDMGRADEALEWLEYGVTLLGDREDDLVEFLYVALIETLFQLGRSAQARAAVAECRARPREDLGLLDDIIERIGLDIATQA